MSEGVESSGSSAQSSTPAPAQGSPSVARTHDQASNELTDRTIARKLDAERAAGFVDSDKRGPDGKFKPKEQVSSDTDKQAAKARPPDAEKAEKTEPEETPQLKKLAEEHSKLTEKHKAAEKKIGEWEDMAEKVVARLDSYKQRVAYLESQLEAAGGSTDPTVFENLSLKEQLRARELADERQNAAKEAAEHEKQGQAFAADRENLRSEMMKVATEFPDLMPPFRDKPEAGEFWQGIDAEIKAGRGSTAELAPRLAAARYVAAAIKAKKEAQSARPQPPRTLSGVGTPGGGQPRVIDREAIKDKYKQRLGVA